MKGGPMAKTRYEFKEGTSNKFWEIELDGTSLTTHWGKIGGSPTNQTKSFPDEAAARKEHDKQVKKKEKEGYQLAPGGVEAPKAPAKPAAPAKPKKSGATDPAAAIEESPDDMRAYLVYADVLQAQGDPRGELIVLQQQNKTKEADALLEKEKARFLGSLAEFAPKEKNGYRREKKLELEWRWGFIRKAAIGWPTYEYDHDQVYEELAAFLDLESTRFLQELVLGPLPAEDMLSIDKLVTVLEEKKKPVTLKVLEAGDIGDYDISSTSSGFTEELFRAFPRLESLTLNGGDLSVPKIDAPNLRTFKIQTGQLGKVSMKRICEARWPRLETLEIWFGDPNYGAECSIEDVLPILDAVGIPRVVNLGLMNCPFVDEIAKRLPGSKVLKQLYTLDLSKGALSDAGLAAMLEKSSAFSRLTDLYLSENALTEAGVENAKKLAKRVVATDQEPDRAADPDYSNRYVSVGE